jgi:spore germination protein KC
MKRFILIGLLAVMVLPGCNHRNELKNLQLIYATALDLNENNEIVTTVSIQSPVGKQKTSPTQEVVSASSPTMEKSIYKKIAMKLAGPLSSSKNQVLLISEKLARRDLAALLDSAFRNSSDTMLALVAIVPGNASDLISLKRSGTDTTGEYLRKIIRSSRDETVIPHVTLHTIYPVFYDPGRDSFIPIIKKVGESAEVDGVSLMHDRKYTGFSLNADQTTLLLLLSGERGELCEIIRKVEEEHSKQDPSQYISVNIVGMKRTKRVWIDSEGKVNVRLHLKLKATIIEYGKDNLTDKRVIDRLNKQLSKMLTTETEQITKILRQSHSDVLGIGRDLIAFHPKYWKSIDWETVYPKTKFQTSIEVKIISKGITN